MTLPDISNYRLACQHITTKKHTSIKDVVEYMGAVQAQDYAMVKLAVGVRLDDATDALVENAINKGEIIRTHVLRPTWHIVSSDDIHWLLELTGPRVKALLKTRHKELEINESTIAQIYSIFNTVLEGGKHATKDELKAIFEKEKISTDDNRLYHILMTAELDGLLCSGALKGKKQSYALLNERVQRKITLTRDEALEKLARRYFTSHAPATIQDFVWWSGLSVGDARKAIEMIKHDFDSETIDSVTYWSPNTYSQNTEQPDWACFLPAFDEFLISYSDRKASLSKVHQTKAIFSNGIFRPIVVINGQVVAVWKRTVKKDKIVVEIEPFNPLLKSEKDLIEQELIVLRRFWGKDVVL